MKKIDISNIVLIFILFIYCCSLQYNTVNSESEMMKKFTDEKSFIQFQNTANIPIFNYKLKLSNAYSGTIDYKGLGLSFEGLGILKNNLYNLLDSKAFNFFNLIDKEYIFTEYKICFPFHFFY